jgi:hypothetical protein
MTSSFGYKKQVSINMTARFSVKNSHIEYDLILVLKKQTPTVKVITVRLRLAFEDGRGGSEGQHDRSQDTQVVVQVTGLRDVRRLKRHLEGREEC